MEKVFSLLTDISLVLLTVIMYTLVIRTLRKAAASAGWPDERTQRLVSRVLIALLGWGLVTALLALSGFLSNFSSFPPRLTIVLVVPLFTLIAVTFSSTVRELLPHVPAETLIRFQAFRIAVEIILWMTFLQNLLPVQMTFEGRNFDVVAGLTSLIAARFAKVKWFVVVWNLFSLGLLINIITVAILSIPSPLRVFFNEPANTIVTTFPFVWLPGFLVPLAYGLHFLSLRKASIKT